MLGSSYGTKNYEEHEKNRSSYCHKPVVQRWTTPPWSWWWWGRCWRRWRSLWWRLWRSFLLKSSLLQPLFSCFCVSAALSSREPLGAIYIVVFRSKYVGGWKNQAIWMIDSQKRPGGAPSLPGHATCPLLGLQALLVRFQCSRCFSWWNIDIPEVLGQFDSI